MPAKTRIASVAAAAFLLAMGTEARADLISLTSFSFAGTAGSATFQPFDPTLGTLDSVSVSVTGEFSILTSPLPNLVGTQFEPYPFTIGAFQTFSAAGPGSAGFSIAPGGPPFVGNAISDGSGAPVMVTIPFTYSFTLNTVTDLAGLTTADNGSLVFGKLANFLAPSPLPADTPIQEVFDETAQFLGGALFAGIIETTASGSASIEYSYAPTAPASIAEPATLSLLGTALLGLGWPLRRRFLQHGSRSSVGPT